MHSRFCVEIFCGLLRELGGGVFAVVVDDDYGELAGVILLEEAGYGLGDGGGFVAGGDDGDDAGVVDGGGKRCGVVAEVAEIPEVAARDREV